MGLTEARNLFAEFSLNKIPILAGLTSSIVTSISRAMLDLYFGACTTTVLEITEPISRAITVKVIDGGSVGVGVHS